MYAKLYTIGAILRILRNYAYTGNLLLYRIYRENHLTKKKLQNNGELPMYHATETHEAIIDLETYEKVQAELKRRAEHFNIKHEPKATYPFTGKIVCAGCGKNYRRKTTATGVVWICTTYNTKGKKACASKAIPESVLLELTADIDISDLTAIRAEKDNTLVFCFTDGSQSVKLWKDRSRAESWTSEMKEEARQKTLVRAKNE